MLPQLYCCQIRQLRRLQRRLSSPYSGCKNYQAIHRLNFFHFPVPAVRGFYCYRYCLRIMILHDLTVMVSSESKLRLSSVFLFLVFYIASDDLFVCAHCHQPKNLLKFRHRSFFFIYFQILAAANRMIGRVSPTPDFFGTSAAEKII